MADQTRPNLNTSISQGESGTTGFWKEKQTATFMCVSVQWLRKRRANGDGPAWVKFSGNVRYPIKALEEYIQESSRSFTGEASNSNRAISAQPINWKG